MADQIQIDKTRADQAQTQGEQIQGNGLGGQTRGLDAIAGIQGQEPDTGGVSPKTRRIQTDAAEAVLGGSSDVVQKPKEGDAPFKLEDQPQDHAERHDDPLSQEGTYEGKLVFRPNELNQAGEDKEYFPPEDQHRFRVPQDAQHHVLRPDVTLKPGPGKPEIEVKDKQ